MATDSPISSASSNFIPSNTAASSMAYLELPPSDHPWMSLVTTLLIDSNYLIWSRGIMRSLAAKGKEGFITGEIPKPKEPVATAIWRRTDNMILLWMLNSIFPQLTDVFGYVNSSHELWNILKERYGQCNGPVIYQLKRKISSLTQGNMSIASYFTKLKKLKDELYCLAPILEEMNEVEEYIYLQDIVDFLMGLNDTFNAIRSQVLMQDPLPSLNKIYGMLCSAEKTTRDSWSCS
ncbi:uncharacterized protein LOC127265986 [Andrographis paniculata]|uniref:uncharacterized protein LOC127265986 n=1 Tax=Andrographis paniculata TaxID=175694 RepID=UPI0021E7648D|nr:uncharacterized protein LOC127265986 [Andrographis paniculata]